MKKLLVQSSLTILAVAMSASAFAGNKDRSGQAGAAELLLNPWAASCGVFGANTSNVQGIEAMKGNIAGLAYSEGTEIGVAYNVFMKGSNLSLYNLSLAQKFGNVGVLGVNIQSLSAGDIDIIDYDHPAGGIGSYHPSFFNVQAGFSKEFSHAIHAGIGVTFVSEAITNAKASGAAFEAGVQYVTGAQDNFHFGVTLRNIGTNMKFSGTGFILNTDVAGYSHNTEIPTQQFEMPTYLNIGAAYDFYLGEKSKKNLDDKPNHRLTAMLAFTSNSFNNDYVAVGLEYAFLERFMLRAGYRYEKDINNDLLSTTYYRGFSAGAAVKAKFGLSNMTVDYSFRPTHRPDNGVHNFSLRFTLNKKKDKDQAAGQ